MNASNIRIFVKHIIRINPYLFGLQFYQCESTVIKYNKILNYNRMMPLQVVLKKIPHKIPLHIQSFLLSTDSKSGQETKSAL